MKTIGLIGGMSWQSTASYYKLLNQGINTKLGGHHSAKVCLYSVEFEEIAQLQRAGDWDAMAVILSEAAKSVEAGGADFLLLCTNTMHKVADSIQRAVQIPMVHIADATGEKLVEQGITRAGLLGTSFTMDQDFYKQRLKDKFGIDVITPSEADKRIVHDVIFNELVAGDIKEESRTQYLKIIQRLKVAGAEGVILGCTEIALLIQQVHTDVPLFDTTELHVEKAITLCLEK